MLRGNRIKERFRLNKTKGFTVDSSTSTVYAQNGQETNDSACINIEATDMGNKTPLTCWEL